MKSIEIGRSFRFEPEKQIIELDGGGSIELSTPESNILFFLFEMKGELCSHQQLEDIGWSGRPVSTSNLTVAITGLRKKLPKKGDVTIEIINIPRKGYYLKTTENLDESHCEEEKGEIASYKYEKDVCVESKFTKHRKIILCITGGVNIFLIVVMIILSKVKIDYNVICNSRLDKTVCSINDHGLYNFGDISEGETLFVHGKQRIIVDHFMRKIYKL